MPSTLQMTGRLVPTDEASIAGVRRSRFSLHLNTAHMRRWLLVQWVSTPVDNTNEESKAGWKAFAQTEAPRRNSFGLLLDEYLNARTLRRSF